MNPCEDVLPTARVPRGATLSGPQVPVLSLFPSQYPLSKSHPNKHVLPSTFQLRGSLS